MVFELLDVSDMWLTADVGITFSDNIWWNTLDLKCAYVRESQQSDLNLHPWSLKPEAFKWLVIRRINFTV